MWTLCISLTAYIEWYISLCEKCPYSELFWSVFSRIRTEYGEMRSISPYSRIQYEFGKIRTTITPNTDTFYAMSTPLPILLKLIFSVSAYVMYKLDCLRSAETIPNCLGSQEIPVCPEQHNQIKHCKRVK